MTMAEDWTKEWERRVVNGVYPLRRFLGRSNHSVVFLTECEAQNAPQAAIKIFPANEPLTEAQLALWNRIATLSHPHLMRLLDSGRCRLGGHNFLFVVTDYAEQNLAQILSSRPLTPDEVRDLLPATLDALAFLHGQHLVQGALKPANFLVVGDQLKLASDTIRPAGERTASTAKPSLYDAPEAMNGGVSSAGDMWGLGITLVEALTQTPPALPRDSTEGVDLPASLAPEFVETIRRCLNRDPAQRPAIAELLAQFQQAPPATLPSDAPAKMNEPLVQPASPQNPSKLRFLLIGITASIITLLVVWIGVRLTHTDATVLHAAAITPQPPPTVSRPAVVETPKPSIAASPSPVVHEELPAISRSARETIRGVIKIAVRVNVDRSGKVLAATLHSQPSSKYFARAALEAAKKWQFAPDADRPSRMWLLHFDLTRAGTTAHATEMMPAA